MKQNLLKYLCCPVNRHDLTLVDSAININGDIIEGKLISSDGIVYLIENGIPNMIPKILISNVSENKNVYERVSESYVSILYKFGIDSYKIAQMDSLRYSIFLKTKEFGSKYLGGIVLEVGAGGNYLKNEFNSKYEEWISLDYDLRSDTIDLRGDGQQLPFKNNMFDTIISIDVLEHVPNPEKFISELNRVIKPGGTIILSTPFFFYMHEEPYDFYRFSKYGLKSIFERNKFEVIEILPTGGVIAIIGLLISIFITKIFRFSKILLKIMLKIHRFFQLKLFLHMDIKIDKNKRFAQGHFIIARKNS